MMINNDFSKYEEDSPIGIGEIPNAQKINRIKPHIRDNKAIIKIKSELKESKSQYTTAQSEAEGEIAVDIYETKDEFVIIAPISGMNLEEIELNLTDDVINIRGKRMFENEISPQNYLVRECFWGNCSRSIILPPNADTSNIRAKEKNSILTITVGKTNKTKFRSIEITND